MEHPTTKYGMVEDSEFLSNFRRHCTLVNTTGTVLYCHITDDPNALLVTKISGGLNVTIPSGLGITQELDFDKRIPITQTTRLLNNETAIIDLSTNRERYLTVMWKYGNIYYIRCISSELNRGHVYSFTPEDLQAPLGFVNNFVQPTDIK